MGRISVESGKFRGQGVVLAGGRSALKGTELRHRCFRTLTWIFDDILSIPECGRVGQVLVTIDFLLFEAPVWEDGCGSSPHGDFGGHMNELEVARLCHPLLAGMCIVDIQAEGRIVVSGVVVPWPGRELLVGRHQRTCDVVRQEVGLGVDVQETDDIVVTDDAAPAVLGDLLRRLDDPVVVCVVEGIPCDLLTLRADPSVLVLQWVSLRMGVQEDLGLTMLDCDGIVVPDF